MGFELGLYLPCNHPDPQSDQSHIYAEILEQAKFAEEIGFAGFAIPEHHFQEGLVVPSSLMMAVKVASITRSARVRTAVITRQTGGERQSGNGLARLRYRRGRLAGRVRGGPVVDNELCGGCVRSF